MANDVSYFKVPGDSTTYSFNDADAENKIGALETTVAGQADSIAANATNIQANRTAIGTLSSLTTDAKGNLVAAVNEVDSHADTNASAISTINTAIGSTALPTTAQTITGAIAEHESDISTLNSNTVSTVFASSDTSKYTLSNVRLVRRGSIFVLLGEVKCIAPSTSGNVAIVSSGMPNIIGGQVFVPAWGVNNASKDALGVQFTNQGVFLAYGTAGGYYELNVPLIY